MARQMASGGDKWLDKWLVEETNGYKSLDKWLVEEHLYKQ